MYTKRYEEIGEKIIQTLKLG